MNPFFRNTEFIKNHTYSFLAKLGYTFLGFEGMEANLLFGGKVWVQASKNDMPALVFTIRLRKQGDDVKWEYERIINPEATAIVVKSIK